MPLISLFWDIRIVSLCIVRPSQPLARLSLYYILVGTRGWGSLVFYMHSYIYLSSQSCILLLAVVVHTVILMTFVRSFAAITLFFFYTRGPGLLVSSAPLPFPTVHTYIRSRYRVHINIVVYSYSTSHYSHTLSVHPCAWSLLCLRNQVDSNGQAASACP